MVRRPFDAGLVRLPTARPGHLSAVRRPPQWPAAGAGDHGGSRSLPIRRDRLLQSLVRSRCLGHPPRFPRPDPWLRRDGPDLPGCRRCAPPGRGRHRAGEAGRCPHRGLGRARTDPLGPRRHRPPPADGGHRPAPPAGERRPCAGDAGRPPRPRRARHAGLTLPPRLPAGPGLTEDHPMTTSSGTVIDLAHPDHYANGIPYDVLAELRRTSPVVWIDEPATGAFAGGPGYCAVLRHADVSHVSRHPEDFSSWRGTSFLRDPRPADVAVPRRM